MVYLSDEVVVQEYVGGPPQYGVGGAIPGLGSQVGVRGEAWHRDKAELRAEVNQSHCHLQQQQHTRASQEWWGQLGPTVVTVSWW